MKNFTILVSERLKLHKEEKNSDFKIINEIIGFFRLKQYKDNEEEDFFKITEVIENWIKENNISDFIPCCNLETLNDLKTSNKYLNQKYMITDKEFEQYNTSRHCEDICLDEFYNSSVVYQTKDNHIDIHTSKNMICCIGPFGTIYCLNYEFYRKK